LDIRFRTDWTRVAAINRVAQYGLAALAAGKNRFGHLVDAKSGEYWLYFPRWILELSFLPASCDWTLWSNSKTGRLLLQPYM